MGEYLIGFVVLQGFSGTIIKPMFDALDAFFGHLCKLGALGDKPSDEAVSIFDGAFFPAVIGLAKVRAHLEVLIEHRVLKVLRSVVIRDTKYTKS